uniref:Uncharacterized protein n=1 Tax=Lotus japonicus TaxID=34305 RepID=I3T067_LOTJA|nr:unknown [Lotus japonicus]
MTVKTKKHPMKDEKKQTRDHSHKNEVLRNCCHEVLDQIEKGEQ